MQSTHDDISVVGGGSSVSLVDLRRLPGFVIAVNDAAMRVPHPSCVLSMDRLWTENRWDWMRARKIETWLRRSAVKNVDWRPEVELGWLRVFECDNESVQITWGDGVVNGTDSGVCGITRACQMRPRRVWLFGFDAVGGYWYPQYSWASPRTRKASGLSKFDEIRRQTDAAGIEVVNVSDRTAIRSFRVMNPSEFNRI